MIVKCAQVPPKVEWEEFAKNCARLFWTRASELEIYKQAVLL